MKPLHGKRFTLLQQKPIRKEPQTVYSEFIDRVGRTLIMCNTAPAQLVYKRVTFQDWNRFGSVLGCSKTLEQWARGCVEDAIQVLKISV